MSIMCRRSVVRLVIVLGLGINQNGHNAKEEDDEDGGELVEALTGRDCGSRLSPV